MDEFHYPFEVFQNILPLDEEENVNGVKKDEKEYVNGSKEEEVENKIERVFNTEG
jgi:hypothetical protein